MRASGSERGEIQMFLKFARYYIPHMKMFAADMTCAFLLSACDLFFPMVTREVINVCIPQRDIKLLLIWLSLLLGIYFLKAGFIYFIQYYGHVMGVRIQADLRRDAFEHLQRLPFSFFDRSKTGSLMSRIINDTYEIAELAHHGPENLFISAVMLLGSFILLCRMNVLLTCIVFVPIPFLVFFASYSRRRLARTSMQSRMEIGEVNASLENSISGVRLSRAFEASEHERSKFQRENERYLGARKRQYRAMAEFFSGTGFIMDLLMLVTLLSGGLFVYYGRINVGDFVAYLLFVSFFTDPIKRMISFIEQIQSGMTGFVRVQELMSVEPERDDEGAVELKRLHGDIVFNRVTFGYTEGEKVLHDFSLELRRGQTVALVGPSGGGKSTLCHLLLRFYELDSGTVTLDGVDIRHYTRLSLRRNIGIVQQDTFLFSGSIRDNIAYGDTGASDREIELAAERALLGGLIRSLPDGYDTFIGEKGVMLSGGQRQRVAIARVFLKNPPLLILDEATSALDTVAEAQIQATLNELRQGRTTLVVAHRLSTIRSADTIVVLTREGIAESGNHRELLNRNGMYAKLWAAQEKTR